MFTTRKFFCFFAYSAWIEENNIKPFFEYKEQLMKSSKSGPFKEAVEAIENFIRKKGDVSVTPLNFILICPHSTFFMVVAIMNTYVVF
jgi:hypothetical protein